MRNLIFTLTVFFFIAPPLAHADALSDAKQGGLLGETHTGYVAAVGTPSSETEQLLERINRERKAKYEAIARSNGTPVAAVEGLAGKKAIELTPRGQFIYDGSTWVKK